MESFYFTSQSTSFLLATECALHIVFRHFDGFCGNRPMLNIAIKQGGTQEYRHSMFWAQVWICIWAYLCPGQHTLSKSRLCPVGQKKLLLESFLERS